MQPDPLESKRLIRVPEAARYLGYSENTIRDKVQKDEIPYIKLSGGALRFRVHELDAWIEEQNARVR